MRAAPPRTKTQYVEQGLREVVNSVNLYTANTLNFFISINNNWQRKINDVLGKGGTGQVMITSSGQKLYGGEIELINVEDHQFDNDIFADPNADVHVRTGSHIFGFGLGVYGSFAFGTSVPATPPPVPEITVPPVEVSAAESTADTVVQFGPHVEGPLSGDVASTFRGGSYSQTTLGSDTTLYRVYGGSSPQIGPYWSRTAPSGPLQSTIDLALNPNWGNTAQNVATIRVPAGTTIYEGFTAPQGGLVGGGNQVYIPKVNPSWVVPNP